MQYRERKNLRLRIRRIICYFFLSGISVISSAQEIPFYNFTNQNGLPQTTVYDIDQDQDGYIWFATQVGAARFDGYSFEVFNFSNGLPDDFVNCILITQKGSVWLGTEGGIAVYTGDDFEVYTMSDGLVDNRVDDLAEDLNGNIWISTRYGLSVLTADTILSYTLDNALFDNYIVDILADSQGRVHVATNPGLTVFEDPFTYSKKFDKEIIRDILELSNGELWYATQDNGIWISGESGDKRLGYDQGLTDEVVLSLMEDHLGRVWCGTFVEGLFVYEGGKFRNLTTGTSSEPISLNIFEDSNQRVWIQSWEGGVWLYDQGTFRHFTTVNNLVSNDVRDIFEDSYGNLWFATFGGASKYGRVIFEVYDTDQGLPENLVNSVYRDSKGRIWFGTVSHLLYQEEDNVYQVDERVGFPEDAIPALSFAEDQHENLYIGAGNELLRYNGRSIRSIMTLPLDYNRIYSLLFTPDQRLWCATDSGIYILNQGRIETILGKNEGLINPWVNSLELVCDEVCCATEGGISLFDQTGKHILSVTSNDGLISDNCLDIAKDSLDNIWVATNRGISKIEFEKEPRITNYSRETGLTSNSTFFVEFVDNRSLWIGTERGINVLDIVSGEVIYYGFEDGFFPLETTSRAITKDEGGSLWIGTVAGLVRYDPRYNRVDPVPPDLILFPPLVNGEEYSFLDDDRDKEEFFQEPTFLYNKNSLLFSYTGIHTTIPSKNRFSYILEGYDDEWSEFGMERSVSYRKLPAGEYIFKVKAYNLDGVGVEIPASFSFSIKPPFWKTVWFIAFEVLMGLLLVYAVIKYRERQLIREKRILETRVKERTREIEDQKVEIEAQRDEITEQKQFVEEQRDQIIIQNKEITDSIVYAKRIQQAVLPGKLTLERTLPDHFILFKPRDIVSGDFYWVEEKNGLIFVCVADCTGHGVPGAFMSMLGLTFLNEIVNKDGILKADEILNRLRVSIIDAVSHRGESEETRDGMDVALGVIDLKSRKFEFAGAYNPVIQVRDSLLVEIKGDKMPIGAHIGEDKSFTCQTVELKPGDMIYMFSDGYKDQFGGEKGGKYKAKPFKRLLTDICNKPVKDQGDLMETELKSWMGKHAQIDDILVMGIRIN